jgi:hypothetical protein
MGMCMWKYGRCSKEMIELRRSLRRLMREAREPCGHSDPIVVYALPKFPRSHFHHFGAEYYTSIQVAFPVSRLSKSNGAKFLD